MNKSKILIIDDEKELCSLLKEFYTEKGYSVDCSHDGQDGIVMVKKFEPDVILLDHRMPVMDGTEVLKKVSEFSSAPIICVSAVTDQKTVDECLNLGAHSYMFKPINLDDLDQAIQSALEKLEL